MLVHKEFSAPVAQILNSLSEEDLKHRILTANGLTLAQEEEILAIQEGDLSPSMSPEELLALLKARVQASADEG